MAAVTSRRVERLVLFDIDGTLLSSAGIAGRAIERALAGVAGRPVDLRDYSYAGRTDPQIVRELLGRAGLSPPAIEAGIPRVLADYVRRFRRDLAGARGPRLHPGVRVLLERLAADPRVCVGLLTGNVAAGAAIKLDHFGIGRFFELGAFGSDRADRNALPAVAVARARVRTGVAFRPAQVIVIGDTPLDIECARRYGARALAVATGTFPAEELAAHHPDSLFADFSATEQVIAAIYGAGGAAAPMIASRSEVYVLAACRTPIGRYLGALSGITAVELGVHATRAALAAGGVEPARVGDFYYGNARQAGNGPNPARQVALAAGLPETLPATTINMACGSGLKAVQLAAQSIVAGDCELAVAGGTESMSRVPYLLDAVRAGHQLGTIEVVDAMYRDGFLCRICNQLMGETAETLAEEYAISRAEQDAYAARSQQRAVAAQAAGAFAAEIVPIEVGGGRPGPRRVDTDEHPRPATTAARLAALRPVFRRRGGTVTAGNSSGIVDGAATVVLGSAAAARRAGAGPLARLVACTAAGVDPARMGIGPVPAVRRLLAACDVELDAIDLIELNEAFAAQVLAVDRELHLDPERLNVCGGAIALGHPIGASGARILTTLVHALGRRGGRRGLATLCVSGGQGMAALVERAG